MQDRPEFVNSGNSSCEQKPATTAQVSSSSSSTEYSDNKFFFHWNANTEFFLILINSDYVFKNTLIESFKNSLWATYNYNAEMIETFNSIDAPEYKLSLEKSAIYRTNFCVKCEHAIYEDESVKYSIAQSLFFPKESFCLGNQSNHIFIRFLCIIRESKNTMIHENHSLDRMPIQILCKLVNFLGQDETGHYIGNNKYFIAINFFD